MGLLRNGLLGALLGGNRGGNSYGSSYSSDSRRELHYYECIYCGKRVGAYSRPVPLSHGKCNYSPSGTHLWRD